MYAKLVKDEYSDIALGFMYKVKRIYADGHFTREGCPRRYLMTCFDFYDDQGNKISKKEAYMWNKEKKGMSKRCWKKID